MVKVPFFQDSEDGEICEHMWINDIYFDGLHIFGTLVNEPNDLTNVEQGESVCVPVDDISDWMFLCNGIPYGGFTVQAVRIQMTPQERAEHDAAWGIDFGDPEEVLLVYEEKEHPENLDEHPMCRNCLDDFRQLESALLESKQKIHLPDILLDLSMLKDFTIDMAVEQIKFLNQHENDFGRVAVITDDIWIKLGARLSSLLTNQHPKYFDDATKAQEWLLASNLKP